MTYVVVKWLHILSSTILFETGLARLSTCFSRATRETRVWVAVLVGLVVWAGTVFTTTPTTTIFQPLGRFWRISPAYL
jgi:uncharacterized membrane protein